MSIELTWKIRDGHMIAKSEIADFNGRNPLPEPMQPKKIGNLHGRGTELYLSILDLLGHLDCAGPAQIQALLEETEHVLGEFLRRKN
ncbi:hypothetical protein ACFWXH_12970 [Mesorhizobium sp. NPDC059054]|uniref:hypothetical protein n=1 Tax=Mesorhizobium sp. NPDC059054 TaxID=3346711 RepID=UPI0036772770